MWLPISIFVTPGKEPSAQFNSEPLASSLFFHKVFIGCMVALPIFTKPRQNPKHNNYKKSVQVLLLCSSFPNLLFVFHLDSSNREMVAINFAQGHFYVWITTFQFLAINYKTFNNLL